MAFIPFQNFNPQFHANGVPLASGTIEFFIADTSTPQDVYSDNTGTVLGTTVTLNSEGRPPSYIFRDTGVRYKYILKNSSGTTIETINDIDLGYGDFISSLSTTAGTAASPAISLGDGAVNDGNTGWYHSASDEWSFSAGGTQRLRMGTFGFDVTVVGSAASPSIIFAGDTNTGWYQPAADQWAWSAGGSNVITLSSSGFAVGTGTSSIAGTLTLGTTNGSLNSSSTGYLQVNSALRVHAASHASKGSVTEPQGMFAAGVSSELTISGGEVTVTSSVHTIDTESDAGTDDLDTINVTPLGAHLLLIRAADSGRTVVCKDGTGNLNLAGDFSLTHVDDTLLLAYDGSANWNEVSRSDNTT